MGVFSGDLVEPLAHVLGKLGSNHVMVVNAEDGLDEISIGAPTQVAELNDGKVTTYTLTPEEFGFERVDVTTLRVDGAEQSLQIINRIFAGEAGAARNIVALNAGAALYVAGLAPAMAEGVRRAEELIDSGAAAAKLKQLAEVSQRLANS
jgi:anthranilate phosphoribosyltransferase